MNSSARSSAPRLSTDEVSRPNLSSIPVTVGAIAQLSIQSDGFDQIGGGKSYLLKMSDGRFSSEARDQNKDGVPDYVKIEFSGNNNNRWTLQFSTKGIDANLSQGTYDDARRVASSEQTPGMEISTNNATCYDLKGSFTIYDVQFDYPLGVPRVISFAATFEQYCKISVPD